MKFLLNKTHICIIFDFLLFTILFQSSLEEKKFVDIKKLSSNEFAVVLYDGIYIYNSDFSQEIKASIFEKDKITNFNDNILFQSYKNDAVICFIDGKIIIYNSNKKAFEYETYNDYDKDNKNNYNLIPFDIQQEKLKFAIIYEKEYKVCNWLTLCLASKTNYKIHFSIWNIDSNGKYNIENKDCEDNSISLMKPICYPNLDYSQIKCFYIGKDDKYYLSYVLFDISSSKIEKKGNLYSLYLANPLIQSAISETDHILFCISYTYSNSIPFISTITVSISTCFINSWTEDGNNAYKISCTQGDCGNLKVFYFKETKQFAYVCRNTNKFIISLINDVNDITSIKCNQKDNIVIECKDNKNYEGTFSLIYNDTSKYYNLITDYNFTTESLCSFSSPEKEIDINNTDDTEDISEMEEFMDFPEFIGGDVVNSIIKDNNEGDSNEEENNEINAEFILNQKDEIMKQVTIGEKIEVETKGFKLNIHLTNSTISKNTTYIEFSECEKLLRQKYNLSDTSTITFFQFEISNDDPNVLINQIKYTAYDENKKELDLTLCKDIDTRIHYNIKNNTNLDLSSISNFKSLGFDLLNINDKFFTDLCQSYSDSGNDMILSDRIKFLYKNYSLCEEGCDYNNIDTENQMIACDCKIQGNISTITKSFAEIEREKSSFLDSNIAVIICYHLVFNFSNKAGNIGFIIFAVLFIAFFVSVLIYFIKGIKPVKDYLNIEMIKNGYFDGINSNLEHNSNPIKKASNTKKPKTKKRRNLINVANTKKESNLPTEAKSKKTTLQFFNGAKEIKLDEKNNNSGYNDDYNKNFGIIKINLNKIKEYFPRDSNKSLHNYTYDEAINYEKRNIFRIFYIYLLSKQIIFRTFLLKSPIELFYLRFTLFIFMFSCDLALNALFYFNDNISKKYSNAKNLFLFAFSNNITIIIYSTLVSYFLIVLLGKLSNSSNAIRNLFRKEEEKIKFEKKYVINKERKREILAEIKNILKYYRIKNVFLIIIELILFLFFWYFVTAFCHVYPRTQTSWLIDSFLSVLSRLIIELILGLLFAKLYQISIKSNIEIFYNILFCVYNFS